jgi:N-acetylneuraminic acid mutarotase
VLVAGGITIGMITASAELYDPATDSWTPTGSMSVPRDGHKAVLLNDGRVMVVAGGNEKSTEFYDPATGLWTRGPSISPPRLGFTLTLLADGKVFLAGGDNAQGSVRNCQLYDPATNRWASTGRMVFAQTNLTATLLSDGRVLTAGGLRDGCSPGADLRPGDWIVNSYREHKQTARASCGSFA